MRLGRGGVRRVGGAGSGGLAGSGMRYTSHSRIRGRVPKEDRPVLLAAFRAEMERQIVANGGSVDGKSLSGTDTDPVGWGFERDLEVAAVAAVELDDLREAD